MGTRLQGQGESCTPLATHRLVTTTNHSVSYFQTTRERILGILSAEMDIPTALTPRWLNTDALEHHTTPHAALL